ncbi:MULTISPECIES: hypothetical protein [Variovorax]|jgi:hypothetical protein|uniref:hypothetical protein n=1 Tax=Variovorax TaxID=34072 RepID=UPI000A40F792|nr:MULTISPECIES: hypothetical protein [Variovorax]MBN8751851.1 hypothetical protein [Variovorax sp.]UKI04892.1 hypothetical protein L3V85_18745 [Variovorax paradoxus]
MQFLSSTPRLIPVLILACVLSACGGGSNGGGGVVGGLPGTGTPTPPDTSVKPEMRCAP